MKLRAIFVRSYKKRNPNTGNVSLVSVYRVTGDKASVEAYAKAQGENLRVEEGTGAPLFFTTRYAGNSVDMFQTKAGNFALDTSHIDKMANLAAQHGGNLGQEIARAAASQIVLGQAGAPATDVSAEKAETADEKLGDMK